MIIYFLMNFYMFVHTELELRPKKRYTSIKSWSSTLNPTYTILNALQSKSGMEWL